MRTASYLLKLFCSLICLSMAVSAHADCRTNRSNTAPGYSNYTQNPVVVTRDLPVGGVITNILSSVSGQGTNGYINCTTSGNIAMSMGPLFTTKTGISHVYATNIPGVGIELPSEVGGIWYDNPPSYYVAASASYRYYGVYLRLIKTGNIASGTLDSGVIATQYGDNGVTAMTLNLTGNSVTQIGCSITTSSLTFPIGNVQASSFGSAVGTIPSGAQNTQSLGLECDPNTNIMVKLNATPNPDVGTPSVMALTGQGAAGVASGVGVQLLYNNAPLDLNTRITLKTSAGGVESLPLTVRYYQTRTSVMPGTANASATMEITYQ